MPEWLAVENRFLAAESCASQPLRLPKEAVTAAYIKYCRDHGERHPKDGRVLWKTIKQLLGFVASEKKDQEKLDHPRSWRALPEIGETYLYLGHEFACADIEPYIRKYNGGRTNLIVWELRINGIPILRGKTPQC